MMVVANLQYELYMTSYKEICHLNLLMILTVVIRSEFCKQVVEIVVTKTDTNLVYMNIEQTELGIHRLKCSQTQIVTLTMFYLDLK